MVCEKPKELREISKKQDNASCFEEWEELNEITDEICLKISECENRCGNPFCYGLQHSDELELAWEEEQADLRIKDSLPDDEFF